MSKASEEDTISQNKKLLIVDDEKPIRDVLSASLMDEGFIVETASNASEGLEKLAQFSPDGVLLDIWMPGDMDGMGLLREAQKQKITTPFVMMSGHGSIESAVEATKLGAWDFIEKPISLDKVTITLQNLFSFIDEKRDRMALLSKLRENLALLGNSPTAKKMKEMVSKVAPSNSLVLLIGEPGVGKELVAKNIHYLSHRAGRPFVDFKCGHQTVDLLEGNLFGYFPGTVVGSDRERKGCFDLADGGTLFLDDVDLLPSSAQAKLFRYLEEGAISRVGSTNRIKIDVRIIAATTKSLEQEVAAGRFREDLYYRLHIVPFKIAPRLRGGYKEKKLSSKALRALNRYDWPGNIREVKNFIERLYILTPEEEIDLPDLGYAGLKVVRGGSNFPEMGNFREARSHFEREYIEKKISENNGNISKTAEAIGLERSYLHRKIKSFGIPLD